MSVEILFREGVAQHQAGQLERAEACYRAVLAQQAEHPDALHYLGLIDFQCGRFDLAVEKISRALSMAPQAPAEFHVNLGNALKRAGQPDRAQDAYRTAVQLRPDLSAAWFNLALLQRADGNTGAAIVALEAACRAPAPLAEAFVELGECHAASGNDRAALGCFEQVLPRLMAGRAAPGLVDLGVRVGRALVVLGRYEQAVKVLATYRDQRQDDVDFLMALGCAQSGLGRVSDAERHLARAHFLRPDNAAASDNLACLYKDSGRVEASLALYRGVLDSAPADTGLWSNYLFTLLYSDRHQPAEVLAEHRRAVPVFSPRTSEMPSPVGTAPEPRRLLRLGYLSGDFHNHPVAYFIAGLLRHHDSARVDVHCYDNGAFSDRWTERLKARVPHWRQVRALTDQQLATQIRQDGIDVLVDLSGHTADNRLAALALRPAPVQASYLGYPFSTGQPWIDWRIVDATTDPPGSDYLSSERLYRLPRSYYAYEPPDDAPDPGALPMEKNGYLTFGVCSNLAKVSPTTLDLWAATLRRFPAAHLFWRTRAFADSSIRETMTAELGRRGIGRKRLRLEAWSAHADRWRAYRNVDVALDTYPYNQATNTCEALWMGVPTLSITGTAHASRMGASILGDAGLGEWVFGIEDCRGDSEQWGNSVAALLRAPMLAELRHTMRSRLLPSRLFDLAGAAQAIETACESLYAGRR